MIGDPMSSCRLIDFRGLEESFLVRLNSKFNQSSTKLNKANLTILKKNIFS